MATDMFRHSQSTYKPLGAYLIEAGLLTEAQVKVVLADQGVISLPFGEIVATRGWLKQETIEYLMHKVVLPERDPSELVAKPQPTSASDGFTKQPSQQITAPATGPMATPSSNASPSTTRIQAFAQMPTPTAEDDESISWVG